MTNDFIYEYIAKHTSPEACALKNLARETHLKVQMPQMLSGHVQGEFLSAISRLLKPQFILEIGTYTGYSAICLADGLAAGGKLITIDVNEELQPMVTKHIALAGYAEKIECRYGYALEIIPTLSQVFELVFIDADKVNYCAYLEAVLPKVRVGGWILADNVLWSGKVLEVKQDKDTAAIHAYNQAVAAHPALRQVIVPIRDGISIAQKIS